jgi:DNA-binding NtrC family response regulator
MHASILVIDDDTALRELMVMSLRKEGFTVRSAESASAAISDLRSEHADLVVSDIYLGDGTGIDIVTDCQKLPSPPTIILVTARGTVETAARARQEGVFDYLAKPFPIALLIDRVHAALAPHDAEESAVEVGPASMIVGNDPAIVEVYTAVARAAGLPVPVLVRGETGTGKELVARALHRFGRNPDGPFVPINCGAIPEHLLESELFGHRRGAFTGATSDHPGAVATASGGTLLLDEVGELPQSLQVKMLRFLQSGEIQPVGARGPIQVDVRVVAATHRDLRTQVAHGNFREDFYYRLAAYEIRIPALRDRRSDIPQLVEHFRRLYQNRFGLGEISGPSPEVLEVLGGHPWPGNVRQLETIVQRAIVDLGSLRDPVGVRSLLPAEGGLPAQPKTPAIGDDLTLEELERLHITAVLERYHGNRSRAAQVLGIERKSLYRKAERLGIELDPARADGDDAPPESDSTGAPSQQEAP